MASYIDKAELVGDRLTNSDMQRRIREMTGTEVYHEVLRIINEMPGVEVGKDLAANGAESADCKACKQSHPWCGGCCNTCSDPCNASQRCRRAGNG